MLTKEQLKSLQGLRDDLAWNDNGTVKDWALDQLLSAVIARASMDGGGDYAVKCVKRALEEMERK